MNPIQIFGINNLISEYLEIPEIAKLREICRDSQNIHPRMVLYKKIYMNNFGLLSYRDIELFRNDLTEKDISFHSLYRTIIISLFKQRLTLPRIVKACNIHYYYGIWDGKKENEVVKDIIDTLNACDLSSYNVKYIESFFQLRKCMKTYKVIYNETTNKIIFISHD